MMRSTAAIGYGWQTVTDVCSRHDPDLIVVIRELGTDAASASGSRLEIIDFAIKIDISSFDGIETATVYATEVT